MSESTEVARPAELLNPATGELVPAADIEKVARTLTDLRQLRQRLDLAVEAFADVIVEESKRIGTRTLQAGGAKLKISAPDELVWDVEQLGRELRAAGLPESRLDELIVAVVTYKVDGTVARQLSGASAIYKAIIEGAKRRMPKRQYVSFK